MIVSREVCSVQRHGGLPKNGNRKEGRTLRNKTREQILEQFLERIKELIKNLLEKLMLEERKLYLEEHPTKGNGYYTRDLLTLFGPLEDLKSPLHKPG